MKQTGVVVECARPAAGRRNDSIVDSFAVLASRLNSVRSITCGHCGDKNPRRRRC